MNALSPIEAQVNKIYIDTILQKGAQGIPEFEERVSTSCDVHFPRGFVTVSKPVGELAAYVESHRVNLAGMDD